MTAGNRTTSECDRLAADNASLAGLGFALRRRGWRRQPPRDDRCLLPRPASARRRFVELRKRYSFRRFIRDVIAHGEDFGPSDLTRYCSTGTARRYLDWLIDARLVRRRGRAQFALTASDVRSFGPTLEWFVAWLLREKLGVSCMASLRLEGGDAGSDYDIIGWLEGGLLYVETKSSPPRNIEVRQAAAFCRQIATLQPEVSIFLNETQLHMGPKIVPLLRPAYRAQFGPCRVERLADDFYRLGRAMYVTNSHPDLVANLGRCVAHRLAARNRIVRP